MQTTQQPQVRSWSLLGAAALAIGSMACQGVLSAELKTTKAADVRLVGDIKAVQGSAQATVNAKLETIGSDIAIEFNQNESLSASCDGEAGVLPALNLAYSWLELDRFYAAAVATAQVSGNYYLHYSDHAGSKTSVTIPNSAVATLTAPTANALLTGGTAQLAWDPLQMPVTGLIRVRAKYSAGAGAGYRQFDDLDNSGSYALDLTGMSGNGTIELEHVETYTNLPGYAESNVRMRNVSAVDCKFSNTPSAKKTIALSTAEQIEAAVHDCLHHCAPNETAWLEFDDQRLSCCVDDAD